MFLLQISNLSLKFDCSFCCCCIGLFVARVGCLAWVALNLEWLWHRLSKNSKIFDLIWQLIIKRVPVGTNNNIKGNHLQKTNLKGALPEWWGEGAVDLCPDCWSFLSPSMYKSWKCFVTSSQASKLRQSETMNYQLSAVYSVEHTPTNQSRHDF